MMKLNLNRLLLITGAMLCFHMPVWAGQELIANLCPSGYSYAYYNDIEQWDVCIASNIYNIDEDAKFTGGCPLISNGNVKQAWNPEAGICFTLNSSGNFDIFGVTRDKEKRRVLVDLHFSKNDANCVAGSSDSWLLSPGEVYCLKESDTATPLSALVIENQMEDYFSLLLHCVTTKNSREMAGIMYDYQEYIDYAYYNNPNIEIIWDETLFDLRSSSIQSSDFYISSYSLTQTGSQKHLPSSIDDYVAETCNSINVRQITGVTN